jgi:hypothetical protein
VHCTWGCRRNTMATIISVCSPVFLSFPAVTFLPFIRMHLYLYACMHVCMYKCMYVRMYALKLPEMTRTWSKKGFQKSSPLTHTCAPNISAGQAECQACVDPGARTLIGTSDIFWVYRRRSNHLLTLWVKRLLYLRC